MATISATALHELLQNNAAQNIIDVRTPVEFAEVHVAAAKSVPLDSMDPENLHETYRLSLEKPVYILCRSGQRAAKAADQLAKAGLPNSIVVEGGTLAWIDAGLPVNRGKTKVISLERQVRIAAGTIVLSGVLLSYFVNPAFIWLSGFVGAGLIFAGISDWCGMGLLIAKARGTRKPSSCPPAKRRIPPSLLLTGTSRSFSPRMSALADLTRTAPAISPPKVPSMRSAMISSSSSFPAFTITMPSLTARSHSSRSSACSRWSADFKSR